ncbi:MAG: tyrosine-type recombinase/integrase [Burkholderiales bacterium]
MTARSERELAAYLYQIHSLSEQLRLGMTTIANVERALRRLVLGAITLERAALAYAERPNLAANTIRRVRSFLRGAGRKLAGLELEALDAPCLQQWIDELLVPLQESTIRTAWRTLRAIARYAAIRGWIGQAPWGAWRPVLRGGAVRPTREALRSVDELLELVAAAIALDDEQAPGFGDVAAKIACIVLLGLRRGEVAGLRWVDVDEASSSVAVVRQYGDDPIKTRKPKTLRVPELLFSLLRKHRIWLELRELYVPSGPVFPQERYSMPGVPRAYRQGECLTIRSLRSVVARAGLPNPSRWSTHSLRDSFVTLEASSPAYAGDLRSLLDRSRHASLASLTPYLRAHSRQAAAPGISLPDSLPTPRRALPPSRKKTPPDEGGLAGR